MKAKEFCEAMNWLEEHKADLDTPLRREQYEDIMYQGERVDCDVELLTSEDVFIIN